MQADQILQVFRLVCDYLPLNDALNLLCMNTYFYKHLSNSLFKRIIVQHAIPLLLGGEEHPESLVSPLNLTARSYESIYESLRSSKNLIKNPYGAEKFKHWTRHYHENSWAIQNWGTYKERSHMFNLSSSCGELHQRIQLPSAKNRILIAKSVIARRWDCGAVGQIVVELDNSTKFCSESLAFSYNSRDGRSSSIEYGWETIRVRCRVPDEVRSVNLILKGSYIKLWVGLYSAIFGMSSLRIFSINDEEYIKSSIRKFKSITKRAKLTQIITNKVRNI